MTEEKIKEKVKKRERIVWSLKRHAQYLSSFVPDVHTEEVQSRLDKIETKFEEFEEVLEEIAELDVEGAYEEDCTTSYEEFEKPSSGSFAGEITNGDAWGLEQHISLPEFDGDYKQWLSFKSTYVSLIHDSGELSDVQKFHYLKSALKWEAAKLIESLSLTNDNYLIACSTITKRYSNEYLLKKRHLQALMEYPKVKKESYAAICMLWLMNSNSG
ncbi:uncharacterized protein LOC134207382 [Armigeres subalbatus]|uniref:uncharacterized protein LOC134207382 n=1 Tax=Armigeres subalbatus TaxID=124917 RepID=UPI002ED0FCB2